MFVFNAFNIVSLHSALVKKSKQIHLVSPFNHADTYQCVCPQ